MNVFQVVLSNQQTHRLKKLSINDFESDSINLKNNQGCTVVLFCDSSKFSKNCLDHFVNAANSIIAPTMAVMIFDRIIMKRFINNKDNRWNKLKNPFILSYVNGKPNKIMNNNNISSQNIIDFAFNQACTDETNFSYANSSNQNKNNERKHYIPNREECQYQAVIPSGIIPATSP